MADPLTARPAASVGKSRAAVLGQTGASAGRSERSEQWTLRAVLSSASDDEVGGFHARLREQLYMRKG